MSERDNDLMDDYCPNCGKHTGGDSICPNCGTEIFNDSGLEEYDEEGGEGENDSGNGEDKEGPYRH